MEKPILSPNFTIEDIHKLREYNYEMTKDMTDKERMDYYNSRGREVQRELEQMKAAVKKHEREWGAMDRKLKVYLDTSVISYLQQEDTPERMKDTLALWRQFEDGKYDIYLSQVTLDEVGECREPKRTVLFEYLSRVSYTKLKITNEVLKVANQIIGMGILTPKSFDDCQHIATAVVHGCDCIISWNFKHIVNIKTIKGIRAITHLESYKDIDIMNPSVLLGGGE